MSTKIQKEKRKKGLIGPAPNGVPISSYHATIKMSDKEIRIV